MKNSCCKKTWDLTKNELEFTTHTPCLWIWIVDTDMWQIFLGAMWVAWFSRLRSCKKMMLSPSIALVVRLAPKSWKLYQTWSCAPVPCVPTSSICLVAEKDLKMLLLCKGHCNMHPRFNHFIQNFSMYGENIWIFKTLNSFSLDVNFGRRKSGTTLIGKRYKMQD